MASSVADKVAQIKKKTEEARRLFNLPDTEYVVQDYFCILGAPGRMYITQNYVCFAPSIGETSEKISFRKILDIKPSSLLFFAGVDIVLDDHTSKQFGSFVHRDEALHLLIHLWKHPVSYVSDEPSAPTSSPFSAPKSNATPASNETGGGSFESSNPFAPSNKPATQNFWGNDFDHKGGDQLQTATRVEVNTEASKNALRLAQQIRTMGTDTLGELSNQAEVLDRIEKDLEHIHSNLDRGDRYIRGMEGFGGQVKNAFSKEKKYNRAEDEDHTITLKRPPNIVEISILLKNNDDSLTPCILQLNEDKFCCVSPDTKTPLRGCSWKYENVTEIVMRVRPLHMDIRFSNQPGNRFRLMSSYLQAITNEMVLRTDPGKVQVVFEPYTKQFAYGSFRISDATEFGRGRTQTAAAAFGFKNANVAKAADILSENVSHDQRVQFIQQEQDLHDINLVLDDLNIIAGTMGNEIDRQNEQLTRIVNKTDTATDRLNVATKRANNIGR